MAPNSFPKWQGHSEQRLLVTFLLLCRFGLVVHSRWHPSLRDPVRHSHPAAGLPFSPHLTQLCSALCISIALRFGSLGFCPPERYDFDCWSEVLHLVVFPCFLLSFDFNNFHLFWTLANSTQSNSLYRLHLYQLESFSVHVSGCAIAYLGFHS